MTIEMKMEQRYEQGLKLGEEKGRLEGGKQERLSVLRTMLEAKLEKENILRAEFTEEEISKFSTEEED